MVCRITQSKKLYGGLNKKTINPWRKVSQYKTKWKPFSPVSIIRSKLFLTLGLETFFFQDFKPLFLIDPLNLPFLSMSTNSALHIYHLRSKLVKKLNWPSFSTPLLPSAVGSYKIYTLKLTQLTVLNAG